MAFVSAIVKNIFLNDSKETEESNPFLDPLPIFNCPVFYARTLNLLLSPKNASQNSNLAFRPTTLFTAEGLTVPVYGKSHQPVDVIPEAFSDDLMTRPYMLQELKDNVIYGDSVLPDGFSDGDNGNTDGADASMSYMKNPTKAWTPSSIVVQP
uniref:Uncharacterized protein U13 n=1 Tax=Hyposoter didymator TaxID=260305 RepID=D7P5N7_HYPDD|nr:unknown [Hyposoter didymator]